MNCLRQGLGWLVSFAAAIVLISSAAAQDATNLATGAVSPLLPPTVVLLPPSPVTYFRKLLAMSPEQLQDTMAKKTPEVRQRILAKVTEYEALDPDERELRLRATELRWYLMQLMNATPDDRVAELSQVPGNLHDLVQSRLEQWEILPPSLQQEFLDNEHALGYFSSVGATNIAGAVNSPSDSPGLNSDESSRWNALPDDQRQAMLTQFNQFFVLSPSEKQKILGAMSDAERRQMQKTLETFDQLPPQERGECVHAFTQFAGMSRQERMEFLKNADRWSKMSDADRKTWRDLVSHVPQWPSLPAGIMPPPMPPLPQKIQPVVATNHG
jgi:hypothetical protein